VTHGAAEDTDPRGTHFAPAPGAVTGDEVDRHQPRHLARASADTRAADGAARLAVAAGQDGDGAMATLMPTARRPPWPASRRARAVARRRVRALAEPALSVPPVPATAAPAASGAARRGPAIPTGGSWGRDGLRRRRRLVLAGMATLLAGGVALALVGVNLVRNSTAGRYVEPAAGPGEPGYQAYVVPTPTMALVERGGDGELAGVAVLALESSDDGGTVILIPAATLTRQAEPSGEGATSEPPTIADVYRDAGAAGAVAAVADLLGVAIPEHLEVDDARWASLVAPVAPVELQLPEPVGEWPAGEVSLAAEDVGPFLAAVAEDESEVDRINRQADFWTAWLPLVRDAGVDALPGEIDVGIGRFVRGLAGGGPSIVPLPGEPSGGDEGAPEVFALHGERVSDLLTRAVPYPASPAPGRRIRVRLLNGTSDGDLTGAAAEALVRGGAEITIAGNALTFDETETRILYGSPEQRDQARWLAAAFGGAAVEQDAAVADGSGTDDDEIDVTVILGDDAHDLIGR
jgi:hypothetical protein